MSPSHPGLGNDDPWIQRAQTRGDLELFDRGIDFPEPNVDTSAFQIRRPESSVLAFAGARTLPVSVQGYCPPLLFQLGWRASKVSTHQERDAWLSAPLFWWVRGRASQV